jgi:hypothetical protein
VTNHGIALERAQAVIDRDEERIALCDRALHYGDRVARGLLDRLAAARTQVLPTDWRPAAGPLTAADHPAPSEAMQAESRMVTERMPVVRP